MTQQEPQVGVCGKRYVFNETRGRSAAQLDATAACPPLKQDETLAKAVAEKQAQDDAAVAELVAKGVKPIRTVYDDGGQNPEFASRNLAVSRPEAIARGPIDIVLDDGKSKKISPAAQMAAAKLSQVEAARRDRSAAVDRRGRACAARRDPAAAAERDVDDRQSMERPKGAGQHGRARRDLRSGGAAAG